jgi:NAD(P)-dependent dehydrogenase (short-subunit alcohol dehydrogenase family)
MEFEGTVAVITGAASGIGRSTALALAKLGTDIVIADIDDIGMDEVRRDIENLGRRALTVHCDVSQDDSIKTLATQAISTFGRIDILMNNAGVTVEGYVEKVSMADWEWILNINLLGIIRGVQAFLPIMLKSGRGYIINTSSLGGILPNWGSSLLEAKTIPYITSKFGVFGFSESLYVYLYPKGIMVSVLCPGGVSTNFQSNIRHVADDGQQNNDIKSGVETGLEAPSDHDMGDIMEPDDVAQIIIKAMKEKKFLILTHAGSPERVMEQGQYLLSL